MLKAHVAHSTLNRPLAFDICSSDLFKSMCKVLEALFGLRSNGPLSGLQLRPVNGGSPVWKYFRMPNPMHVLGSASVQWPFASCPNTTEPGNLAAMALAFRSGVTGSRVLLIQRIGIDVPFGASMGSVKFQTLRNFQF